MERCDLEEFTRIMFGMADNFRDSITKEGLAFRFNALKRYSIQEVRSAANKIVYRRKYTKMPTIADFVEIIEGPEEAVDDCAVVEANRIIEHLVVYGATSVPNFTDKTTALLMTKRWPYTRWASKVLESDLKWWVREFCEAYRSIRATETHKAIAPPSKIRKQIGREIIRQIGGK